MKSKLLLAVAALTLLFGLPLLAQGGGGQWSGQAGGFDMEEMQQRWVERAVGDVDTDDDGELSKEEFLSLAVHERYSYWFEEDDGEDESEDEEAGSAEADDGDSEDSEATDGEESEEDALTKLHEAKFEEADADDDGNVTVDELIAAIDFEAAMERMRDRFQRGGGGQRGQGGQGGGNWQRP